MTHKMHVAQFDTVVLKPLYSDVIGDCGLIGDTRWAGTYGVDLDFIALEVRVYLWCPLPKPISIPAPKFKIFLFLDLISNNVFCVQHCTALVLSIQDVQVDNGQMQYSTCAHSRECVKSVQAALHNHLKSDQTC